MQSSQMLLRHSMLLLSVESAVRRAAGEAAAQAAVQQLAARRPAAAERVPAERVPAGELASAQLVAWPQPAQAHLARPQAQRHHRHQCRYCFRQLLRAIRRQRPRHQPEQQFLTAFPTRALESLYQLCQ